jgi:hypothetical protein
MVNHRHQLEDGRLSFRLFQFGWGFRRQERRAVLPKVWMLELHFVFWPNSLYSYDRPQ